jgi:hypothetical protein
LEFKAIYDQVGAPWALYYAGPASNLSFKLSPDNNNSRSPVTSEFTDGVGRQDPSKFGKAGKLPGEFSTVP